MPIGCCRSGRSRMISIVSNVLVSMYLGPWPDIVGVHGHHRPSRSSVRGTHHLPGTLVLPFCTTMTPDLVGLFAREYYREFSFNFTLSLRVYYDVFHIVRCCV
jgi:hypothetical protein